MNEQQLAIRIANDIFEAGSQPNDKAQRIAFKGGDYPNAETNLGGFCQRALVECIHASLVAARDEKEQVQP